MSEDKRKIEVDNEELLLVGMFRSIKQEQQKLDEIEDLDKRDLLMDRYDDLTIDFSEFCRKHRLSSYYD